MPVDYAYNYSVIMRIKPHIISYLKLPAFLVFFFGMVSVASLALAPTSYAAGETYAWSGSDITMRDGALSTPASLTVGDGATPTTLGARGEAILYQDSSRICKVTIGLEINSDLATGTITQVSAISAQGGDVAYSCSPAEYDTMAAWRNSSIHISGKRSGGSEETKEQQYVYVTLINPNKKSSSPKKVTFSITSADGKRSGNLDVNIGDDGNYAGLFTDITPGKWKVCVDKIASDKCKTIEKFKNQAKAVRFDNNQDLRRIFVTVEFDDGIPVGSSYKIELKKGDKSLDSKEVTAAGSAKFTFDNVNPGSYQVCYKTRCVNAVKQADVGLPVLLKLSQADVDGASGENTTSCAVDGVGWIICPIMGFMGGLNDAAFGFISDFLTIEPKLLTDTDTRAAWSNFRDIANVAFVIAFLIIVYSQITGTGVSNYGIKRMLPRLFIAAVLVNLSYFVCQIAVDLSNILGSSIYSFFKDMPTTDAISATAADLPSWKKVIGFVLVGAAALVVGLLAITTISTAALLAFALIILILIARKAALILLVVVSPLAFVAYLLPNTEKWFKKWWKMFSSLLLVFPVVGIIFGASTLAARIINNAGGDPDESNYMLQITALGVMAVPLFAVPIVLKSALSAAGSIGTKLSGMADRAQGAAASRSKKRFSEQAERMKKDVGNRWNIAAHNKEGWLGRSKLGAYSRYKTRRDSLLASREGEAKRSGSTYMANQLGETDANGNYTERAIRLQNAAAGGSAINQADESARVRAAAVATQGIHKQFDDDVSAFKTTLTSASNDQLIDMISNTALSSEQRAAAAGLVMSRSHRESHIRALDVATKLMNKADTAGNSGEVETLSSVQKQMAYDMKDKPWALGDQATGQLVEGKLGQVMHDSDGKIMKDARGKPLRVTDMQEEINKRVGTKLSAASLANMNPDEMKRIHKAAITGQLNDAQKASLKTAINEARSNPQINNLIKPEAKDLHDAILNKIAKDEQDAAAATYGPNI